MYVSWTCQKPGCGTRNETHVDIEVDWDTQVRDHCYECGVEHEMTVAVDVWVENVRAISTVQGDQPAPSAGGEPVGDADRPAASRSVQRLLVSRDEGKTWTEMDIDINETDPARSPLNEGDLVRGGALRRVYRVEVALGGQLVGRAVPNQIPGIAAREEAS